MEKVSKGELERVLKLFIVDRQLEKRYASFDFCYNYFYTHKGHLVGENMQTSCMHLWAYLASWGMLRGSAQLLQCSPASLKPLIELFEKTDIAVWKIDVDTYTKENIEILINTYKSIEQILSSINVKATKTLVTKIMLGVFENVPAYDAYFTTTARKEFISETTCGFRSFSKDSLECISLFYNKNKSFFDSYKINVIDFDGQSTKLLYSKAKLIDMYGFIKGQEIENNNQK